MHVFMPASQRFSAAFVCFKIHHFERRKFKSNTSDANLHRRSFGIAQYKEITVHGIDISNKHPQSRAKIGIEKMPQIISGIGITYF